nr:MAG TPA: hypothetical protein [Caudoviricetes sp.]
MSYSEAYIFISFSTCSFSAHLPGRCFSFFHTSRLYFFHISTSLVTSILILLYCIFIKKSIPFL